MKGLKHCFSLALVLAAGNAWAQWAPPVPSATVDMATDGTAQFLYNKEAGGFFAGANDWSTRASIDAVADSIKFVSSSDGLYNFLCFPSVKKQWLYVSCNNYDAMWVDAPNAVGNSQYPGTDKWVIEKNNNGAYTITNTTQDASWPLGVAESYQGNKADTRAYIYYSEATYVKNDEEVLSFEGDFYSDWVFVSAEEYEALKPQVEVYLASRRLHAAIDNVKNTDPLYDTSVLLAVYNNMSSTAQEMNEKVDVAQAIMSFHSAYLKNTTDYPGLDFSAQKAVYDNTASTSEDIKKAEKEMLAVISNYLASQASFDNPTDFTSLIGDSNTGNTWIQTFTSDGKTGDIAFNTWSTEAENGGDGTDMLKPFCQVWTASGGILSNQRIHQTIGGMPAGLYLFKANVRVYNEAKKIDQFEGAYMFVGNDTINLQDEVKVTYSGNKSVLWSNNYYVIAIVREPGDLELGFELKNVNFNWIAYKQTSFKYYGNEDIEANAIKLFKQNNDFPPFEDMDAQADLIEAYSNALAVYESATTLDEAVAAAKEVKTALMLLEDNVKAYNALKERIEYWKQMLTEKNDLSGEYWDAFSDFVNFADPVDGYPEPSAGAIDEGDRSLTTEEIYDYISKVDELYAYAVTQSLSEGSDCTDMLVNPSFSEGFTGWTTAGGNVGGLDICKNVEVYENVVQIQQVVKDVPNGIYSLTCQAFERPSTPDNVNGEEESKVFLFMNDFQTPVMNISKDIVSEADAVNKENCYIDNGANSIGEWPLDSPFSNGEVTGYMPNSMDGASYAFSSGRYKQKVYGFVDNGEMRIGLTSNGQKVHWTLWANFRLTYEGRTNEALDAVLPDFMAQYKNFLEMNEMTKPMKDKATNALSDAEALIAAGSAENKYAALTSLNATLNEAKANAALLITYIDTYIEALELYENASDEGKATFDSENATLGDYENLTTEELQALLDKLKDIMIALEPTSGEEELATPSADKAVIVGKCYTAGEHGEITNSRRDNGFLKIRTSQNGETITFSVNEGYVITGISIYAYSNNNSSWADRSITLTGVFTDGSENSVLNEPHVFNGGMAGQEPTLCEVTGFAAFSNIVLAFDNSNIVDSATDSAGKNKQLQAIIKFTYERPTSIDDKIASHAKQTEAIYLISGQKVKSAVAGQIVIQDGKKYIVK